MTTLGFDIDGVLYPWHELVYEAYKDHSIFKGLNFDFSSWWEYVEREIGWDSVFCGNLSIDRSLYNIVSVPTYTKEILNKLSETYNIVYITSRPKFTEYKTLKWLYLNNLPYSTQCYFTHGNGKTTQVLLNNCEVFFEDRQDYIEELSKHTNVVCIKKPYNKKLWDVHPYVINSINQREVNKVLEKIELC